MARHFPKQGESSDSSDEALLSAGWGLRRAPTPPQVLPAPVQLRVEKTHFSGEVRALQESSTAGVGPRANYTFKDLPSGSFVSIRIRAVGAKGAGPWCDPITARVP